MPFFYQPKSTATEEESCGAEGDKTTVEPDFYSTWG